MSKRLPEKPARGRDVWDAEIEAEFQHAVRQTKVASQPTRRGWQRHSTTVPREWELRLKQATRISTYRLALELLYRRWRVEQGKFGRKGEPVIVSSEVTKEAGLSTRSMQNALCELERFGLIEVVRARRRSPRATLLHV